jgi:hypothetical protein
MQRAAYLNSSDDSYRLVSVFSGAARIDTPMHLITNRSANRGRTGYCLYGTWSTSPYIPVSASEFRHICLLFGEISTHGLPKELTWNA